MHACICMSCYEHVCVCACLQWGEESCVMRVCMPVFGVCSGIVLYVCSMSMPMSVCAAGAGGACHEHVHACVCVCSWGRRNLPCHEHVHAYVCVYSWGGRNLP